MSQTGTKLLMHELMETPGSRQASGRIYCGLETEMVGFTVGVQGVGAQFTPFNGCYTAYFDRDFQGMAKIVFVFKSNGDLYFYSVEVAPGKVVNAVQLYPKRCAAITIKGKLVPFEGFSNLIADQFMKALEVERNLEPSELLFFQEVEACLSEDLHQPWTTRLTLKRSWDLNNAENIGHFEKIEAGTYEFERIPHPRGKGSFWLVLRGTRLGLREKRFRDYTMEAWTADGSDPSLLGDCEVIFSH